MWHALETPKSAPRRRVILSLGTFFSLSPLTLIIANYWINYLKMFTSDRLLIYNVSFNKKILKYNTQIMKKNRNKLPPFIVYYYIYIIYDINLIIKSWPTMAELSVTLADVSMTFSRTVMAEVSTAHGRCVIWPNRLSTFQHGGFPVKVYWENQVMDSLVVDIPVGRLGCSGRVRGLYSPRASET